jgi:cytochrome c oxidase assembly protein subunit 15
MLMEPAWRNLFENITTVQFNHRVLAVLVAVLVIGFWWLARRRASGSGVRLALDLLLGAVVLQVALGILTLLLVVPVSLAAAHQAGAVILLTAIINAAEQLRRPDALALTAD